MNRATPAGRKGHLPPDDLPAQPLTGERVTGSEIERLLALTHDPNPRARVRAAQRLCPCHVQANEPRVWDRLIAMSSDADVDVRRTIFHALADGSPRNREQEIVHALDHMANDSDPRLRRRVRQLIAHYRRTGEINIL